MDIGSFKFYTNCSMNNSFYQNEDGVIFSFGRNCRNQCLQVKNIDKKGVYSRSIAWDVTDTKNIKCPKRDSIPKEAKELHPNIVKRDYPSEHGTKIIKFSCGWSHVIILLDSGNCYSRGYNCYGQLTTDNTLESLDSWKKVVGLSFGKVVDVNCGNLHNIFTLEDNSAMCSGYNSHGQLGDGTMKNSYIAIRVHHIFSDTHKVFKTYCGGYFTVWITMRKRLFACGCFQQKKAKISIPMELKWDIGMYGQIKKIGCGSEHMMILSEYGKLYGIGSGSVHNNLLGKGSTNVNDFPSLVTDTNGITDVSCGFHHTIFCDQFGDVYGFGNNSNGELGIGKRCEKSGGVITSDANSPERKILNGKDIIQVICGRMFSFAISSNGTVFGAGYNCYGDIGIDNLIEHKIVNKHDRNTRHISSDFILRFFKNTNIVRMAKNFGSNVKKFLQKLFACQSYIDVVVRV